MNLRYMKYVLAVAAGMPWVLQDVKGQTGVEADFTVFSTAGGTEKVVLDGEAVTVDWNMGEPVTEAFGSDADFDASKKRLTQGFEQGEGFIEDPFDKNGENLHADEDLAVDGVRVYPNPVHDMLHVSLPERPDLTYTLDLRDLHGNLLRSRRQARTGGYRLDMSRFPAGVYLLEVGTQGGRTAFKIVKVQ